MLSVREVAERLGISIGLVYKKASAGEIRHHRFGRRIVFSEEQIREFLQKTEVASDRLPIPRVYRHITRIGSPPS